MPNPQALPEFRHRFVPSGDLTIHVAELPGSGPALLLLHGIGMDWRVWQAISRRLHPHFHLYMLDLRGHGESDKPLSGYTLAHYAADVEDVLEYLDLRGVALVGSSLGGMVVAAVEAPADIVSHRVLVDPPLTGGPIHDAARYREILRLKHEPVDILADFLAASNAGTGSFQLRAMSEMWHEAADGVIIDMLARPQNYFALDAALRGIDVPVLLLQADPTRGGVLSDAQAERSLTLLPCGSWRRVAGAGHAIHAFKPAEFTELLVNFTQGR